MSHRKAATSLAFGRYHNHLTARGRARVRRAKASIATITLPSVALAAALSAAPPPYAQALPTPCTASSPGCQIVPGMHDGVQGQPCANWASYSYGYDPNGLFLACVSYDNGRSGTWSRAATISAGVKPIGSPCCPPEVSYCSTGYGALGQAPDGRPLTCVNGSAGWTWVPRPFGNLG